MEETPQQRAANMLQAVSVGSRSCGANVWFKVKGFRGLEFRGLNTILGIPDYDYSILYPKTLFQLLRPLYYASGCRFGV